MRLSLRFIVPLGIALTAIAYAVVPLVDRLTLQWFVRDLEIRSTTIANAAQEPLTALVREPRARQKVLRYFERIIQDERIFAIGFELRVTRLGHVVRGGSPTAADRILATRLGSAAVETLVQERHGVLVGASRNEIVTTPLAEIAGRTRPADAALLELARVMAI